MPDDSVDGMGDGTKVMREGYPPLTIVRKALLGSDSPTL
jgi:hypothetical protein